MRFSRRLFMSVAAALIAAPVYAAEKLNVVATTGMIADAARQVGGDLVDVRGLMGPGVDPHAYRQTRTDIVAMTRADLVLWHGLYLEAQMEDFFRDLESKRRVVAVAEGLPTEALKGHDDYADKFDPHVWMDPALWSLLVAEVRDSLIELQPESEALFEANADAHLDEIAKLAAYSDTAMATVPEEARVLLTAHDAFGYFGKKGGKW